MSENSGQENKLANTLSSVIGTVKNLKESNPKAFYGAIAGVFLLFLFILNTGGGGNKTNVIANVKVGEQYSLKNPNVGKILLVAVPGKFSSSEYDEEDSQNVCVVEPNTRVKLLEETVANYIPYIKVEPQDGDCQGKKGWTSKVNLSR